MTGIVNSTGARSGVIGTTVGTPAAGGGICLGANFITSGSGGETTTLTTTYVNLKEISITLASASSDVYGWLTFNMNNGAGDGCGVQIFRNTSATVTTSHTAIDGGKENPEDGTGPYIVHQGAASNSMNTWLFKDTITGMSIGQAMYYGFFAREYAADDTTKIGATGSLGDGFISMTVMEISK